MAQNKEITKEKAVHTSDMHADKANLINAMLSQIEKQYGKGTVIRIGDGTPIELMDVIPTGSMALDIATGIGGWPMGRIVEIYGQESSGKTTLALHAIAEAQKKGYTAAFVDAEHALDLEYAKNIGVNVNDLYVTQPDNGEQALEITDMFARSGVFGIVVIDSVAALTPKSEIEGLMGEQQIGSQARLMSHALRKLIGNVKRSNTLVIFINQTRMKIGAYPVNAETTSGGVALKFYATMRAEVKRIGIIKMGENKIGNHLICKMVKNKVYAPFKQAEIEIYYGEGISRLSEIVELGSEMGIIDKSGAWYSYNGERIGQGKENVRTYLKDNTTVANTIEKEIKAKLKDKNGSSTETKKKDDDKDDGGNDE